MKISSKDHLTIRTLKDDELTAIEMHSFLNLINVVSLQLEILKDITERDGMLDPILKITDDLVAVNLNTAPMIKIIVFTFTISLLMSLNANSQNSNSEISFGVNHIAIAVTDLQESEHFYREVIGLKQIPEPFGLGIHAWFEVGSTQLHVIKAADERIERNKYTHICFSVNDMDTFIERISEQGVVYSDWNLNPGEITTRVDGVKQIYFTDPDGYWIEVNDGMLE